MHQQNKQGLTLEELQQFSGFQNMTEKELERALTFISQMTEIIYET
jgi:hypothetical protein